MAGFAEPNEEGNGKYWSCGELGGRGCFEKREPKSFLYCLAQRTWCIAPKSGMAREEAWATMEASGFVAAPPVGEWRVNSASASGKPRVEAMNMRFAGLEEVTRPGLRRGGTYCYSSAHTYSNRSPASMVDKALSSMPRPSSAPQGARHNYEKLTKAAMYRQGLQLGTSTSSTGNVKCSKRLAQPR